MTPSPNHASGIACPMARSSPSKNTALPLCISSTDLLEDVPVKV
jgi:hypothetical protein